MKDEEKSLSMVIFVFAVDFWNIKRDYHFFSLIANEKTLKSSSVAMICNYFRQLWLCLHVQDGTELCESRDL